MNIEANIPKSKKQSIEEDGLFDDLDFKPITSGLGFHHSKAQDVKPVFTEKTLQPVPASLLKSNSASKVETITQSYKSENQVYQSDLSLFYGNTKSEKEDFLSRPQADKQIEVEESFELASKSQRVFAYLLDLSLLLSSLSILFVVMARIISLDLIEAWTLYPNELTQLFVIMFSGFYLLYFSIFEKSSGSTFGKNIMKIKVVDMDNNPQTILVLLVRSFISYLSFLTLGLFCWFDLQNKITHSKVIRVK